MTPITMLPFKLSILLALIFARVGLSLLTTLPATSSPTTSLPAPPTTTDYMPAMLNCMVSPIPAYLPDIVKSPNYTCGHLQHPAY